MIIHGESLEEMRKMDSNSVDTIITDPPYGLYFMGKKWDYDVPSKELWQEALRVLKPGGTALIFAGSRTQHRMAVNVEDAGFELKDCIMYLYGSGFPKATDIYKQLKKKCTCGIMGVSNNDNEKSTKQSPKHDLRPLQDGDLQKTINPDDKQGEVLQSSLQEQSVQVQQHTSSDVREGQSSLERGSNVEESQGELQGSEVCEMSTGVSTNGEEGRLHIGTQASNGTEPEQNVDKNRGSSSYRPQSEQQQDRELDAICDQCRTQEIRGGAEPWEGWKSHGLKPAYEPILVAVKPNEGTYAANAIKWGVSGLNIDGGRVETTDRLQVLHNETGEKDLMGNMKGKDAKGRSIEFIDSGLGRFPANLILDSEAGEMLDEQSGELKSGGGKKGNVKDGTGMFGSGKAFDTDDVKPSKGGASRFFYCAKASKVERNAGCEGLEEKYNNRGNGFSDKISDTKIPRANNHPTVKPLKLMEYLCTLTKTPTGGIVLDPFAGSGTTLLAAKNTGRDYIGIEREAEYIDIIKARLDNML